MTVFTGIPAPPSPRPTPIPLAPRIVWPSLAQSGGPRPEFWLPADSSAFPDARVVGERHKRGEAVTHLPMFRRQAMNATDRILIVDTYLLCGGERAEQEILLWLPDTLQAHDIRIACGGLRQGRDVARFTAQLTDRAKAINARKASSGVRPTIIGLKTNLDPSLPPFVHDRFAVVDDELWHFGATVGGLHHGMNAATRGWNATATGAVRFFTEAWSQRARGGAVRTACGSAVR